MSERAPTDVEISRALNALATTLGDQRPPAFDTGRFQRIVDGALAGERKLDVVQSAGDAGFVVRSGGGTRIAEVRRSDGRWTVERQVDAKGSTVALPEPEASQA